MERRYCRICKKRMRKDGTTGGYICSKWKSSKRKNEGCGYVDPPFMATDEQKVKVSRLLGGVQ